MEGLSKLTESFLPFIVLIVFAGVRILGLVRRQARNREQSQKREAGPQPAALVEDQGGAPQKDTAGIHPWEDEYREVEQGDPDDEFSAWSLSVNDDEPVPSKTAELPAKLPMDAAPSLFTGLSSTSSVPVSGEIPAWLQSPVQSLEVSASVQADGETRVPEAARTPGSIESRIRALPPLQQGVMWAEILGTPKGF